MLVGHSMGGMTIVALAEEHPELFGDRVVGVGLVGTTAGGVEPQRISCRPAPRPSADSSRPGSSRPWRAATGPSTGSASSGIGFRGAGRDRRAGVRRRRPARYVEFVDEMLSATPFGVVADFFPTFGTLEKFETVHAMSRSRPRSSAAPATSSRRSSTAASCHSMIEGSTLLECDGAGHMVMLERHDQVNAALDQMIAAAGDLVDQR